MDLQRHLIELSEAAGLSGYEGPVRDLIRSAWEGLADEYQMDGLGSLIAIKRGTGKSPRHRLLVTSHMDEIGLIVSRIEGAFLQAAAIGGMDGRTLLNQPVIVHGERPIPALISSRPPHVVSRSQRGEYLPLEDLVVDTGLTAGMVKRLVKVGAPISFDQKAKPLGEGLVAGKAMDNRTSVAALTLILHELQGRAHAWDVLVAATVQEEVGLHGGITTAWQTEPDIALVIDTTWALGVGVEDDHGFPLGGGPTIVVGPNAHPKLFDLVRGVAEQHEIPLTPEPYAGNPGAESWATQISREGIPSVLLSIPIRNMHTPVEIAALKDIERTARLAVEVAATLDGETLHRLALDAEG